MDASKNPPRVAVKESELSKSSDKTTRPTPTWPGEYLWSLLYEMLSDRAEHNDGYPHGWTLMKAVLALNAANSAAFASQFGLIAVHPKVSKHFSGDDTIEWAATIQLVGLTVGPAVLGYLSDTWSRRLMLLLSTCLLALSSLACGTCYYSKSADTFATLRFFSGVAIGSISNLVNIAQNDILAQERRQNFQAIQGLSVCAGSIMGLVVGSVFAEKIGWHHFYWFEMSLGALAAAGIYFSVTPHKPSPSGAEIWKAVKTIDFIGILSGSGFMTAAVLLLCKMHTLGKTKIVVLAIICAISGLTFLVSGFRNFPGVRPIVPFHLFRNWTILAIYIQNFLIGATFYSFVSFTPITLQVVRGLDTIDASLCMVPFFMTHGMWTAGSAQVVRYLKYKGWRSYSLIFLFGFGMWMIAMIVLGFDSLHQYGQVVLVIGVLVGLGTGSVFQNSVMAICSQVPDEIKAVAVGTRNVLRFSGGAFGTAMSNAIVQNFLRARTPQYVANKAFSVASDMTLQKLSEPDKLLIRDVYAKAIATIFFTFAGAMALCVVLCFLVKDAGTQPRGDEEKTSLAEDDLISSAAGSTTRLVPPLSKKALAARTYAFREAAESQRPDWKERARPSLDDSTQVLGSKILREQFWNFGDAEDQSIAREIVRQICAQVATLSFLSQVQLLRKITSCLSS